MGQIAIVKKHLPGCWFDESQDCTAEGRLATTGFSNQTQRFADVNVNRDTVNRFHAAIACDGKVDLQISDGNQRIAVTAFNWRRHLRNSIEICFLSTHVLNRGCHSAVQSTSFSLRFRWLPLSSNLKIGL